MSREFLTPVYDPFNVVVSVALAMAVAYASLDVARRGRTRDATLVRAWWIGGSLAMGTGIWALQFLAVLSLRLDIPLGYNYSMIMASWVCAVTGCALTAGVGSRPALTARGGLGGALAVAVLMVFMNVLGVLALDLDPAPRWDGAWLGVAAALALGAGVVSVRNFFWMHHERGPVAPAPRWVAGSAFGALLAAPPYATLRAARFPAGAGSLSLGQLGGSRLDVMVGLIGAVMVVVVILWSLLDERLRQGALALKHSLQEANEELKNATLSDPLTHLPNRLVLEDRLDRAMQKADAQRSKFALLFVDLDGFKAVNESFGHSTGDALLREAAQRMSHLCRHTDTLVRVGADEFLMLLDGPIDSAAAAHVARRVLDAIGTAFRVGDQELALSCSVGIAFYPEHGPRSKLVANADAAMIAAKRAGGGLHCMFEPKMAHDTAQDEIELQRDLRHAIERGELMLYYQPKINARSLQVTGAEALLRWKHPVRGMVSPAVFIPLAERFGLIGNLGHWVLEEACRQVREWLDDGLRVRVAINLSVHQLRQADFVHRIREVFQRHQIDPSLITFEITESVAMEDTQATMHAFERLASAGVILSIDDFGTGYSSLSYLRKLCARQLKIDRSFIQDLNGSADAKAIVEAVIGLAHALGLNVVAEGVETADQQRILQELGCDELQGFLFAKPMPAPQLTLWAREDERPEMASGTGISFSSSVFDAGDFDAVPADFLPTEPHLRD